MGSFPAVCIEFFFCACFMFRVSEICRSPVVRSNIRCVCVCVCVCARMRVHVCVCVCVTWCGRKVMRLIFYHTTYLGTSRLNFDVLLTGHLSIILVINQLDAQNLVL